ncbi:MAG: ATP-dependent Clp protease proteolytic subunit [Pseudomonadota bacterium]
MGTYRGLLLLIALCALVVYMALAGENRVFVNNGRLTITQDGNAVVLKWRSGIEAPMARRFEEAFDAWADKTDEFVIDLNSPGGSLAEGKAVIRLIDDIKRTHHIETHVGAGRSCLSMCVPIFLRGDERRAAASSRWMFHQPSMHDAVTGEEVRVPNFEKQYVANRFVERYFENSDIDAEWLARLEREWDGKDIWRTGGELYSEGSNIILEIY